MDEWMSVWVFFVRARASARLLDLNSFYHATTLRKKTKQERKKNEHEEEKKKLRKTIIKINKWKPSDGGENDRAGEKAWNSDACSV